MVDAKPRWTFPVVLTLLALLMSAGVPAIWAVSSLRSEVTTLKAQMIENRIAVQILDGRTDSQAIELVRIREGVSAMSDILQSIETLLKEGRQ